MYTEHALNSVHLTKYLETVRKPVEATRKIINT
jgi:hypothetical protein